MKNNVLFLLTLVFMLTLSVHAQRGVSLAYIDSEYILENVPEYQEATAQLNQKADKWKNEIQAKLLTVEQKRKDLSNEKALLTAELIKEREEDITFEENEILDYQQKRFGPNGDLFIQKRQLMQPVQDQIFAAVQTIVAARKYQLVLDKANGGMLYVANSLDISDQVLRSITRTSKRTQVQSKAERKAAEKEDIVPEVNLELEARQKILEEKKAERESAIETARQKKLAAREAKVKAAADKRQKILDDREKAKQERSGAETETNATKEETETASKSTATKTEGETKTRAELIEENRLKKLKEREERKKALEAKRQKILEDRQKAKDSLNKN
ncbi:OmpH family outer membrane protein [Algibacter wandonensis]|uniref:Periplasmic chaperone for outer membrane proteins Skp n=2 Tax=Algibacter lectus TaxID=221126 RepID=A0A4R8M7M2_9FLAO|nr:OmpH family outer membrane protein [Algibacter lectus]TDY60017.1 periplasmic chaperone for outer membrane proteins Skp [Algibacter lectus]